MSTIWKSKETTPGNKKGWYITRREDGDMQWRAWGCQDWWKQFKGGGWIRWFNGDGEAMRFDWMPRSRKDIALNSDQLPDVEEYIMAELQKPGSTG
jgi:hypothetical protein